MESKASSQSKIALKSIGTKWEQYDGKKPRTNLQESAQRSVPGYGKRRTPSDQSISVENNGPFHCALVLHDYFAADEVLVLSSKQKYDKRRRDKRAAFFVLHRNSSVAGLTL